MIFATRAAVAAIALTCLPVLAPASAQADTARSLYVKVYEGNVPAKDLFNSDPYVSVTVCEEKAQTPVDDDTTRPRWHWSYTFKNVTPACRIKFHVYDSDSPVHDDDLGQIQMTVGQFLYNNEDKRQTLRAGDSYIEVKARWETS
ncbi:MULTISPECIES: C2 domain-containing protein [unclassified Streptomyces]|uniref:C2 domain-containing protein n=1 Tax=unclassified Streptomyces TaxID=2593676 RepID=UPI002E29C6B1|nr:C2 domain-containing protein [Streptomyces sp. NBC_00228]